MANRIDWEKAKRRDRVSNYPSVVDGFIPPSEWAEMRRNGQWPLSVSALKEKHHGWYQKHRKKRRS